MSLALNSNSLSLKDFEREREREILGAGGVVKPAMDSWLARETMYQEGNQGLLCEY
jgi:hypothetical protein